MRGNVRPVVVFTIAACVGALALFGGAHASQTPGQLPMSGGGGGGLSLSTLDARYLKLDASNDPVTESLDVTKQTNGNVQLSVRNTQTSSPTAASATLAAQVADGNDLSAYLSSFSSTYAGVAFLAGKAALYLSPLVTDLLISSGDKVRVCTSFAGYPTSAAQCVFEVETISGGETEVVVNQEGGSDDGFRVEGDADASLIDTDPVNDRVGIGDSTPDAKLDVGGTLRCDSTFTHGGDIQPTGDNTLALGADALRYVAVFATQIVAKLNGSAALNLVASEVAFYDGSNTDVKVVTTSTAADGGQVKWVDTYTTLPTCDSTLVGSVVFYDDSGSNQKSFCGCEQTGVGTHAWGALVAGGDCT